MEELLAEMTSTKTIGVEDAGPSSELEFWRTRMGRLNSVTEQLKGRDCKVHLLPLP